APEQLIRPRLIEAADLTGDGRPDLVLDTQDVLVNRGDGTFTVKAAPDGDHEFPNDLALIDFDGNGTTDRVTMGLSGLGVALGQGDGTFAPPVTYAAFYMTFFVDPLAIADLTGDGKPDVAVPSLTEVAIFVNTSTPTSSLRFAEPSLTVAE